MECAVAAAEEEVLLHGYLLLTIIEARSLPNMDSFSENLRRCFAPCRNTFLPRTSAAPNSESGADSLSQKRHHHHMTITSDPYVTARLAGATVARTRVISNSEDPVWNDHFKIPVAHRAAALELRVKDNDVFGAQLIGTVSFPATSIASGKKIQGWYPVVGSNGKPPKPESSLRVSIEFIPVEDTPEYQHGIAGDPKSLGVRDAYFPLRPGGSVTLYQDAHVNDGELPEVRLEKGATFKHEKCWEDICQAILEAHHLIYIVGWSIFHKVKLVREPTRPLPQGGDLTLGELLKYKSQEGVRVCMLVWDDKTSHDKFLIKTVKTPSTIFSLAKHSLSKFSNPNCYMYLNIHLVVGFSSVNYASIFFTNPISFLDVEDECSTKFSAPTQDMSLNITSMQ